MELWGEFCSKTKGSVTKDMLIVKSVIGELVSESMLRLRSANIDAENLFSMTHDKRRRK